jgi:hypothetical protein
MHSFILTRGSTSISPSLPHCLLQCVVQNTKTPLTPAQSIAQICGAALQQDNSMLVCFIQSASHTFSESQPLQLAHPLLISTSAVSRQAWHHTT